MAITTYSQDADLQVYEPTILQEGVPDFSAYHALAFEDINRILKADWWPTAKKAWLSSYPYDMTTKLMAEELEFDPQFLGDPTQLKQAACYRVLGWYAYEILAKYSEAEPDRYEKKKDVYQEKFKEEIALVIASGIQYDFSRDGQITFDERAVTGRPRTTRRA